MNKLVRYLAAALLLAMLIGALVRCMRSEPEPDLQQLIESAPSGAGHSDVSEFYEELPGYFKKAHKK